MNKIDAEASRVIEHLGGNAKTAALCEVTPSAVSQWLKNGIPRAQRKFLQAIRPEIFGITPTPRRRRSDR